jgi:small subunit ribosomal protein S20
MPITARAEKKLRHDRKRTKLNAKRLSSMRTFVKTARKNPVAKTVDAAFKALDKAAKTHSIHKNKAARIKSRLAKLIAKPKKSNS